MLKLLESIPFSRFRKKNGGKNLFTCSGMRVKLKSESGIGGEGVSKKVRQTLGDIWWRQSEPQILDRAAERCRFSAKLIDVFLLLLREN